MRSLYALAVLLLLAGAASASKKDCSAAENAALVAVKAAFNNASYFASWTPATRCCRWNGVNCDASTGHVISLAILQDDNVFGPIPGGAIAGLTYLQALTLSTVPGVYGPIPQELAGLPALFELTISRTGVSGPVPSFLGALTQFKYLDLSFNWLTGAIPPSLAAQAPLVSIILSGNRLSGRIPAMVVDMAGLIFFNVSYNRLCGEVPSGAVVRFGESAFEHNKCICGGAPLPPCHTTNGN